MSSDDPMIGLSLGNYEIIQKLAQGGMGIIYQARHTTLNRIVAIKFLASHFSEEKEYVERFLREARAAAMLNHPNIISVYDAGVADDVYYLIMEYIKGHDLGTVLNAMEAIDEKKCIRLMKQAASALSYAHAEGIIHQDIKPQNLILTTDDQIKICDLGLATLMSEKGDSLLSEGEVIGTPYYISPEQVQDAKNVDSRTDIYSLGATFYHLITGKPPFLGDSNDEIMTRHLNDPFPSPRKIKPEITEGMEFILSKAMARELDKRYQIMDELVDQLTLLELGKPLVPKAISQEVEENDSVFQSKMGSLQRRLMGKTDFPSMSGTMGVITKLVSVTDNTTVNELAEAILADFALTNKILKLVNSVFYSGFGEKIGTVSQAVMVLGLGQVRNAALSLMLFENLTNRPLAREIKESSISNYLSGVIAKNLAVRLRMANREEAFISAIFHNLGKLLVTFYLPDERKKIDENMEKDKTLTDDTASRGVLGKSFEHFGMRVGREWNFPDQIIQCMERLPMDELPKPKTVINQLHCIVVFSNVLCSIMRSKEMSDGDRESAFQIQLGRFKNCFPLTLEEIAEVIDVSLEELALFTKSLDMKVNVEDYLAY